MRTVSAAERRRVIVRRHLLDGSGGSPGAVTSALLALHATDPATVYLSVLARSSASTLADVGAAMYERRDLVRWMAMRRTLFVFDRDDIPMIQSAVSTPLAATLRRTLVSQIRRNGTEPAIRGDAGRWLARLEKRIEQAVAARGDASGTQLSTDVPELRTVILPRAPSDEPRTVTSPLLTLMSAEGRIVRATATGAWTSRHHRWESVERWWPGGMPDLALADARRALAHRWLERFAPATLDDLQWWTGWTRTDTRAVLATLDVDEVDLDGAPGITVTGDDLDDGPPEPAATLLAALDPTPMGWKHREWFLGMDRELLFDRAGNIGPTIWWDGEIVGGWAIGATGEIRTKIVADRGHEARAAVDAAAALLHDRLDGVRVTPAIRTPLERSLLT